MPGDHSHQGGRKIPAAELLRRLSSAEAGVAWVEFLERYSSLIMNSASQFVYEQDRISECFLYVCEQLNDDGFRRLLKFNTTGKAKFRTWLGAVVFNLCVDWHRREFGRAIMSPAISALPAFDQSVYRLVIEKGMDKETCFQLLRADFPELTRELVANAAARVFSLMTPRQRWQVGVRLRRRTPASDPAGQGHPERIPDPGSGPESAALMQQELDNLQNALALLPADQRLLVYLRFQEGLSLEKIAQVKQLGDSNRVWRNLQTALNTLYQHLRNNHPEEKNRKN